MPRDLEETIRLTQEILEQPSLTAARFLGTSDGHSKSFSLQLGFSQRSLSAQTKRNLAQTLQCLPTATDEQPTVICSPLVETSSEVKHVAFSKDGKLQAFFRVIPAKEGKEARKVIEIVETESGRRVEELEVTKDHGDWYFDATFGPPSWHSSGTALVYTAEAPPPKPTSEDSSRPQPDKFNYTPDFGETFTGKREPTLFMLVLSSSPFAKEVNSSNTKCSLHRLTAPGLYGSAVFGQPTFLDAEQKPVVIATAYSPTDDDRKLGIVYCQNRRARICALELAVTDADEEEAKSDSPKESSKDASKEKKRTWRAVNAHPVSAEDRSARSARVVPAAKAGAAGTSQPRIVYVSNTLGGVHASCAKLQIVTLGSNFSVEQDKTLVPIVQTPQVLQGLVNFPGLYIDQLPVESLLVSAEGSTRILVTSTWRSRRVPIIVDLESGEMECLAPWPTTAGAEEKPFPYLEHEQEVLASYAGLATDGRSRVLASRSSPRRLPELVVCDLAAKERDWTVLRKPSVSTELAQALESISHTILPLPEHEPSELILASPTKIEMKSSSSPPPLIVQPHGGPHSAATNEFSYSRAAAVIKGYRFVDVNYPGSTGFGQKTIDDLPPVLGTAEVEATLAAGRYLKKLRLASGTRAQTSLMGGSHGGWTACHLTARWPEEYGAVVMRNPVTDLVANASMTDIPDWCYEEGGFPYSLSGPPDHVSPEEFKRFYEISPMRHAKDVTTPTLLLIGLDDRRVPPNQGRAWYHALKKQGKEQVEVKMMTFAGNGHPISETVEAEWVAWESGLRWLVQYTDFAV